jgi:hypothetical protein
MDGDVGLCEAEARERRVDDYASDGEQQLAWSISAQKRSQDCD